MSKLPPTDTGLFHNTLQEMFVFLNKAYPDDPDLPYYQDQLEYGRKINAKLVVEKFLEGAESHIVQIFEKDESYFLNNIESITTTAIKKKAEEDSVEHDQDACEKLISKVTSLWKNMSDSSKLSMWKFFQILVTLAVKVTKRNDLIQIVNNYRKKNPLKLTF